MYVLPNTENIQIKLIMLKGVKENFNQTRSLIFSKESYTYMHVYINMCVHIYNSSIFPFYNGPPNKNFGLHLDCKI